MSPVQCHFCSRPNTADAMFCEACGGQLSLRPCPTCDAVNDVGAEVCYVCKGALPLPTLGHSPEGDGDHNGMNTGFEERRPDYARIGLVRPDGVTVANAVVTFDSVRAARRHNAARLARRALIAVAGVCAMVGIGVLFFDSARERSVSSAAKTVPAQSYAPEKSLAPEERTGSTQVEPASAVGSTEPPQPPTSESGAKVLSSRGSRPASGEETRIAERKPPSPPAAARRPDGSGGVTAAGAMSGGAAACAPGVAALGLCASDSGDASAASHATQTSETPPRTTKPEARHPCDEAAAALGLCAQTISRGEK